jgi:hypothetical protein
MERCCLGLGNYRVIYLILIEPPQYREDLVNHASCNNLSHHSASQLPYHRIFDPSNKLVIDDFWTPVMIISAD